MTIEKTRYDEVLPDYFFEGLAGINPTILAKQERRFLIIDVDNTAAYRKALVPNQFAFRQINEALNNGILHGACLVSNIGIKTKYGCERVEQIAKSLGFPCVFAYWPKIKPHPEPFLRAMQLMGSNPENTAVIGDQMFSDILGGKRLGLMTILVRPLGSDSWITQYKRWKERQVAKAWRAAGRLVPNWL